MEHNENNQPDAVGYWKANVRLILSCLSVWALASYGFALILRPMVSSIKFGGTDLGFWFAQQGSIITFIIVIFFYAWRMNKLDKEYGLEEE